jgi:predicted GIY-YIG superfamily endonuclease
MFIEWTKMTAREEYSAYSRTSDGDNVKINIHKQPNYVLYNELQNFFKPNYAIYKWISSECNDIYVGHTKDFEQRKKEHLHDAKTKDNDLYKKMREFGGWEMERLEDFYASNRTEAQKIEQKWIDNLNSNLNMCNAYKVVI